MPCLALILTSPFITSPLLQADTGNEPSATQSTISTVLDPDKLLAKQRQLYKKVNRDLQRGSTASFSEHHDSLKTYPLYPYLHYTRLSRSIKLGNKEAVDYFLNHFGEIPAARILRRQWLQLLYRKQHWQFFMAYYDSTTASTALQCKYQFARYKSGLQEAALLEALALWTVGKSQAKACDPLFKLLIDKAKITEAIAWQRYTQAVLNHKFQLARYIKRFFVSQNYRDKAAFYLAVDREPAWVGDYAMLSEDFADNRALIEHGIAHLAKHSATEAMKHWARYRQSHRFDEVAQSRMLPHLVKGLHKQGHSTAALGYLNDNIALADKALLEWQLRALLRANDWTTLVHWTGNLPEPIRVEQRWRYWQARAQLMTSGDADLIDRAKTTFRELSRFRSFYGFLSSDRVGNPYRMAENPLLLKVADVDTLANSPSMLRVRELFVQGENLSARREWYEATKKFAPDQWLVAAQLAHREHWHPQAILAMAEARYWDDIKIRFPQPYRQQFEQQAQTVNLPLTLLFAIARQESAFAADANSPAGARGLMQLMPRTAQQVARQHNIRYKSRRQLFEPDKNLSLGSRYFKDLMLRFADNRILAIASYNAGPHRVHGWRKKTQGRLPYDVWIETIPFAETRQYVQNVLTYTLIFAYHLDQTPPILSSAEKQQLL